MHLSQLPRFPSTSITNLRCLQLLLASLPPQSHCKRRVKIVPRLSSASLYLDCEKFLAHLAKRNLTRSGSSVSFSQPCAKISPRFCICPSFPNPPFPPSSLSNLCPLEKFVGLNLSFKSRLSFFMLLYQWWHDGVFFASFYNRNAVGEIP